MCDFFFPGFFLQKSDASELSKMFKAYLASGADDGYKKGLPGKGGRG